MQARSAPPETIHPSLWRASQLARGGALCVDTGHAALTAELPGAGWPAGHLIELLLPRPGIGELRLLLPVLRRFAPAPSAACLSVSARESRTTAALGRRSRRSVLLIQPPHVLQPLALSWWGVDAGSVLLLRAPRQADAFWAAEQALRAGTCDLVLLWADAKAPSGQPCSSATRACVPRRIDRARPAAIRSGALRRLNLAAQAGPALLFLFRASGDAAQPSPAPLRLALEPAPGGVRATVIKRQGPRPDQALFVPLEPSPVLLDHHVRLDRRVSAVNAIATARLRTASVHA